MNLGSAFQCYFTGSLIGADEERAKNFSWGECVWETMGVLEKIGVQHELLRSLLTNVLLMNGLSIFREE
jgi:hypothetical protein